MAAMAETPETLSNSLAFLQIDLIDPDFHKHALAHSKSMHAGIKRLLDEAVAAHELERCDTGRLARAVQSLIGGSLLGWAVDRDGKANDRIREDLDALLKPRHSPRDRHSPRARRRHLRQTVRRG